MWILISFLLIYEVYQLYYCWNSPQYRTNFQYCFWVATCYVCSWVKQRIYNKYLKNSQLFTSKSSQSSLISFSHGLFNVPLSRSTQQLATSCECILKSRADLDFFRRGVQLLKRGPNWRIQWGPGACPPPPFFLKFWLQMVYSESI